MGSPGRIAMLHKWVLGDQTIDLKQKVTVSVNWDSVNLITVATIQVCLYIPKVYITHNVQNVFLQ